MIKSVVYSLILIAFIGCNKSDKIYKHNALAETHNEQLINSARQLNKENVYSQKELNEYVNGVGNLFTYEKSIGAFNYFLKFKPIDYIIMKESSDSIKSDSFLKRKNEINDFDYFTFIITIENFNDEPLRYLLNNSDDYYKRLSYLANEVGKDLKYFNGSDTVDCSIFHFERTFGVSPYLTLNLAFEKSNSLKDRVLFFEDNLFNNGRVIFTMPNEIFVYQPKLIID